MKRDELDLLIKNGYLASRPDKDLTENELNLLVSQGFLEELPNHFFAFNNNLTWEVIYETLLYSERRLLHNLIALHIEKHNQDKLGNASDLLLYHFDRALNYKKSVYYGAIAGENAASMYAIEDSVTYYNRSLNLLNKIKSNTTLDASLLHEKIADIFDASGQFENAVSEYQKALNLWQNITTKERRAKITPWKIKPAVHEALLYRKIAMASEHNSDYDAALAWLEKAEKKLPNRPGIILAKIYNTRSATLYRKGMYTEAILWGKKALTKSKKLKSSIDLAYANNMLANSYIEIGKITESIKHLKEASYLYSKEEDLQGISASNYNLARCFGTIGDFDSAEKYFNNVLEIYTKMHDLNGIAMVHFNLGNSFYCRGKTKEAIDSLTHVANAYKNGNCRQDLAGMAFMLMSRALLTQADYEEADKKIKRSIDILNPLGESPYLANAKLTLAELNNHLGEYPASAAICKDILKYAKKSQNKLLESLSNRIFGIAIDKLGQFESSINRLEKSISLAKQAGSKSTEASSILEKSKILFSNNAVTQKATDELQYAIDIFSGIGASEEVKQANNLLSDMKLQLNQRLSE